MKKLILSLVCFIAICKNLHAQSVGINDDATPPFSGAMLDVKSTNKGILIPRMTTAQRLAMPTLTSGLLVFDTDLNEFQYFASGWKSFNSNSGWQLTGNTGIDAANFLGTTNNAAMQFRTNNINRFTIDESGNLLVASPTQTIRFPSTTDVNAPMLQMFSNGTQNTDRMIFSHSPGFPRWGIEYKDTTDVIFFRDAGSRKFSFGLANGFFGIGTETPSFPIDLEGRMRIRSGIGSNAAGIWFNNQTNNFTRALFGMSKPDSTIGIFSQHMGKWAVEFEVMREPRIGINTRVTPDGVVRAELHVVHTNFGGSNDGVRIQNEGPNANFWNLYTSNTTNALEFFNKGIKKSTIDGASGAYTAVSDERLKQHMTDLSKESILPRIMQLRPSRYQMKPMMGEGGKIVSSDRYHFGFSAQQVLPIFPELVFKGADAAVHDFYTMNYAGFGVLAIKAIQEQQSEIDQLKKELAELKDMLKKQIANQ